MKYIHFKIIFLILLFTSCHSGADSSPKLIGGGFANPKLFPGIVNLFSSCTGAKIGEYLFVTAAHCLYERRSPIRKSKYKPGAQIWITGDVSLETAHWHKVTIETIEIDERYAEQRSRCIGVNCNGIAKTSMDKVLIYVKEKTPTINIMPYDLNFSGEKDQKVVVVGYGCEKGLEGSRRRYPRLKYGLSRILPESSLYRFYSRSQSQKIYAWNIVTHGNRMKSRYASLCPGDSGGPLLFWKDSLRSWTVIGINSYYSFEDGSDVASINWHARL